MRIVTSLVLALLSTAPALAQSPSSASAPAKAQPSADTPIADLIADPATKAVLDRNVPGLTAHPAYEQIKTMSLRQVQPMSGGQITEAALAKVDAELKTLPGK